MLKKNKGKLIVSSLVTLLPILFGLLLWEKLPEHFATHWGIQGEVDGWSSKACAIFLPPLFLLAAHWLCVLVTAWDPKNQDRNHKLFQIVLWILPITSHLCSALMYALALEAEFDTGRVILLVTGLLFLALGNYLPKCRQNLTLGIKIPWVYTSEENWNATHRFSGKVWMIGGLIIVLSICLPGEAGMWVMLAVLLLLAVLPILYSCLYYRRQKQQGDSLVPMPKLVGRTGRLVLAFLAVVSLFVALLLFTGSIDITYGETSFTVEASFYSDKTVQYRDVETIEYRDGSVSGSRINGVGSFRLLLGLFKNEEFGTYTRYTYYQPESCVVLTVKGDTLVISGEDAAQTEAIYTTLCRRIAWEPLPEDTTAQARSKSAISRYWLFMFAMDLLIPLIMVLLGKHFMVKPPKEINSLYGYRTVMSSKNQDTWEFAHRHYGNLSCRWGMVSLVLTVIAMVAVLPQSREIVYTVGSVVMLVQILILLATIPPTEKALRRTFDKNGNRK